MFCFTVLFTSIIVTTVYYLEMFVMRCRNLEPSEDYLLSRIYLFSEGINNNGEFISCKIILAVSHKLCLVKR
jgi:hypothetical protein